MNTEPPARRRRFPVLRQWYTKLLYVIVAIAIFYVGGGLAPTDDSRGILRSFLVVILFLLATRVFRSAAEPDDGPRPLWRMTGRPLAGWVLGVIFALVALSFFVASIGISSTPSAHNLRGEVPILIVTTVLFAGLAVLYLTSSIRLRGLERANRTVAQRGEH